MTIYSCEPQWEAMLTCIYEAWSSKKGHKNIKLCIEPIEQYTLFDEYIHVDSDIDKATKLMNAINMRISTYVYNELLYASMAYEPDILDVIYRVLILGFAYGPNVLKMVQFREVMRFNEIRKRVANESHSFREFIRFHKFRDSMYISHIEPKSRLVLSLAFHFSDRMPSENWMIVDDIHKEALIHPADKQYYLRKLTDDELSALLISEAANDEYTDMWKVFFDSIAIKERANAKCQRNLFPVWKRKHAVEFTST